MLNLSIAMLRSILLLALLFQNPVISISYPFEGATLRGQVEVLGNMDVPNFASAELAFGYIIPEGGITSDGDASNSTDTWFTIQTYSQAKVDVPLIVWNTTSVTDGDYRLRLRVFLQDGSFQDAVVTDLKLRNDGPEPVETPFEFLQPVSPPLLPAKPTSTPTLVFLQSTPLPPNPASLTVPRVYSILAQGALIAFVVFVAFSFLLRLRKNQNL